MPEGWEVQAEDVSQGKGLGCARLWEVEVWERAAGLSQGPKEMWNRGTFVLI